MMAAFDIKLLTENSIGVIDVLITRLNNLKMVIEQRQVMIEDEGSNDKSGAGFDMIYRVEKMVNITDIATKDLERVQYKNQPIPPCYTGSTGPIGWGKCPSGVYLP